MGMKLNKQTNAGFKSGQFWHVAMMGAVLLSTLAWMPSDAWAKKGTNKYAQVNLVSDVPDLAVIEDSNLVNPWGMSFSASSPFWVSDNAVGVSTLYAVTNGTVTKQALVVARGLGAAAGRTVRGYRRDRESTRRRGAVRTLIRRLERIAGDGLGDVGHPGAPDPRLLAGHRQLWR